MQKALRGLEVGVQWFSIQSSTLKAEGAMEKIISELNTPGADRIWYIG